MNLSLSQIKDITQGVESIIDGPYGYEFHRFSRAEEEFYNQRRQDLYVKTFCTAGVKMDFNTNSENLKIALQTFEGTSRKYFALEVVVNGEALNSINNYSNCDLSGNYTDKKYALGKFDKQFSLGSGDKRVEIYFPWSVNAIVEKLEIDDGAYIIPMKKDKKLLVYGDSVTQGYDTLNPSNRYTVKLASFFNAEEINKAVGGETFVPGLLDVSNNKKADIVLLSYGSNDWRWTEKNQMIKNCESFLNKISTLYSSSRILVLTPIWRKDLNDGIGFGDFSEAGEIIKRIGKGIKNLTVIDGYDFVPKDEKYFADLRLHPSNVGFEYFYKNLIEKIDRR